MRWFGRDWYAPITKTNPRCAVPVWRPCAHCTLRFTRDDQGLELPVAGAEVEPKVLYYHLDCFLDMIGQPIRR